MASETKKFETARTRKWRATALAPTDERTIGHIEEFGCSVISVGRNCKDDLGWSYTIGVFDTCAKPELIVVGLKFDVARASLNEAVRRMRAGIDLTKGRHADLLGNVECELRPVHFRWVNHLMNWANWYYEGLNYPVLQVIYPDLENRFPEDASFDKRFAQPMMRLEAPNTEFDQDFWNSVDESGKFADWKFPDPPHTGVYLSRSVQSGSEPVTYVSHDSDDGAWQFLGDSMSESGGVLSCMHHPIDSDPSLIELADLPLGWYGEREAPGLPWHRFKLEPEDDAE